MRLFVRVFCLPKEGHTAEEYEDAFYYSLARQRFAVADGATDSAFAARWARGLVQRFISFPPLLGRRSPGALQQWLAPLQHQWHEEIDWKRLPWYGVEKAQAGAFSTLLGLEFIPGEALRSPSPAAIPSIAPLRWRALAIGDSCLFHVRDTALLVTFPLTRAAQFGNRPLLWSSNPVNNSQHVWTAVRHKVGGCRPGDLFLLATDALAQWIIKKYEVGTKPWTILCAIKTKEDFAACIAHLRRDHAIRNDDVTLLTVRLGGNTVSSDQPRDAAEESHTRG